MTTADDLLITRVLNRNVISEYGRPFSYYVAYLGLGVGLYFAFRDITFYQFTQFWNAENVWLYFLTMGLEYGLFLIAAVLVNWPGFPSTNMEYVRALCGRLGVLVGGMLTVCVCASVRACVGNGTR